MLKRLFNNKARKYIRNHNEQQEAKGLVAPVRLSSIGIRAKVTRADGTVEPERLVSYGHLNPAIHLLLAPLAFVNGAFWNLYYTLKRRTT